MALTGPVCPFVRDSQRRDGRRREEKEEGKRPPSSPAWHLPLSLLGNAPCWHFAWRSRTRAAACLHTCLPCQGCLLSVARLAPRLYLPHSAAFAAFLFNMPSLPHIKLGWRHDRGKEPHTPCWAAAEIRHSRARPRWLLPHHAFARGGRACHDENSMVSWRNLLSQSFKHNTTLYLL